MTTMVKVGLLAQRKRVLFYDRPVRKRVVGVRVERSRVKIVDIMM